MWLVRHGQTNWNVEGRYQGQSDVPLNATGLQQARALAAEIDGLNFTAVYSSDLVRARVTAEIIAQPLHLVVQIDVRLREINQGLWEGEFYNELQHRYPAEMLARNKDPYRFRPPNGESAAEVTQRVTQAADEIAHFHPNGQVLVVSHGLALAALYCKANAISMAEVYNHLPNHAHPVVIEWPPAPDGQEPPNTSRTTV
jgi:alpha-ribazole phosphatase